MVDGTFLNAVPLIPITIAWRHGAQTSMAVLDTGFSGDLQITPAIAKELGIQKKSVAYATMADGKVHEVPISLAIASMENVGKTVQVLVSEGVVLAGIGFLSKFGYKAIVDCKYRKVMLQKT